MKKLFGLVVLAMGIMLVFAPRGALAGGSSDSTGEEFHCYLFFNLPDEQFAQVMVNGSVAEG